MFVGVCVCVGQLLYGTVCKWLCGYISMCDSCYMGLGVCVGGCVGL